VKTPTTVVQLSNGREGWLLAHIDCWFVLEIEGPKQPSVEHLTLDELRERLPDQVPWVIAALAELIGGGHGPA
jgi:hypothetical protein